MKTTNSPFTVSLWLMPPPHVRERLYQQIVKFSNNGPGGVGGLRAGGVVFEPHITVVGGIKCFQSMDHAREILETKLAPALQGIGPVRCEFTTTAFMVRENDGSVNTNTPVWSQAAVLVMQETEQFRRLGTAAHHLLGLDHNGEKEWTLAPPIGKPHLSLYYGTTHVPAESDVKMLVPIAYESTRLELWKTHPSGVEGVKDWELIGSIPLSTSDKEEEGK